MIGKTYDSDLNSHQPFGMLLGEKPTEPVALDLSNKSLSTSSPFEFRIRTDFWSVQNREFEFEGMGEEQSFGWLNIDIESDGTLNFSGIAPVFEGTVPIQFAINENISGESLVIQFTIEISSHLNQMPIFTAGEKISVIQGEISDLNYSVYDLDGDEVFLEWDVPSWVSIHKIGDSEGFLRIEENSKEGDFIARVLVNDSFNERRGISGRN